VLISLLPLVGIKYPSITHLKEFDPEVVAFITAQEIINTLAKEPRATATALRIGRRMEAEMLYTTFQKREPALFNQMRNQVKGQGDERARTVVLYTYQKHIDEWEGWSHSDMLHLGMKMVELFRDVTGFVALKLTPDKQAKKTSQKLCATPAVLEWMERNLETAQSMAPFYFPMVVPPVKWTGAYNGGYLDPISFRTAFVKTYNPNYLTELDNIPEQMAPVYEAVNEIQETAWQVNTDVLDVFTHFWERGAEIAGLPPRDHLVVPPFPCDGVAKDDRTEEQQEAVKLWKRDATAKHLYNSKITVKRMQVARQVGIAIRFKDFDKIYFPHSLDFRGRVYPVGVALTPQGSDTSKGLLRFAKGKPLGDATGPGWLAIHGANTFGFDKASLEARIDWVMENEEKIKACGEDPLTNQWWSEADSPWCFLAFCIEWAGFLREGGAFVSHLAVALDGSCSGLQHFSAALKDEIGGSAVNLLPHPEPSDVYQEVADKVIEKLRADVPTSEKGSLAARVLDFGVNRKTTKRSTMTLPYGSTKFSCRQFLLEWIVETAEKMPKGSNPLEGLEMEAASLLSEHVWSSIGEVVVAARVAMDWLRECASVSSKAEVPLLWTTPDGFPVSQAYMNTSKRRVKTRLGDQLIYAAMRDQKDSLDVRRQANGVAPNWVHSMDATHLRMAVLLAKDNGVRSVAVVHDSFGTLAADTDMLAACLRESLVSLYTDRDNLAEFRLEICSALPTSDNIPQVPEVGNLNLNLIKESDFVFA